jgi:hypothetical protein
MTPGTTSAPFAGRVASPHRGEATRGSIAAPFFLSTGELRYALEHPGACSIYRIFDLGVAAMTARAVLVLLPSRLAPHSQRVMTAWVT